MTSPAWRGPSRHHQPEREEAFAALFRLQVADAGLEQVRER